MTARPRRGDRLQRREKSGLASCGVSTAVGSSRMRMRASRYRALSISTRWRSPTDRSRRPARQGSTDQAVVAASWRRQFLSAGLAWSWRHDQQALRAQRDVFQHGQVFGQREVLMHHADTGAEWRPGLTPAVNAFAVDQHRRPHRPGNGRTECSSASSCPRRSPPARQAPRRVEASGKHSSLAARVPKRLVTPRNARYWFAIHDGTRLPARRARTTTSAQCR